MDTNVKFIEGEVWRHSSSWWINYEEHSGKTIWPWQTAMKGISTEIRGLTNENRTTSHMSIRTTTRWLSHKNHLMLKLAGKIS